MGKTHVYIEVSSDVPDPDGSISSTLVGQYLREHHGESILGYITCTGDIHSSEIEVQDSGVIVDDVVMLHSVVNIGEKFICTIVHLDGRYISYLIGLELNHPSGVASIRKTHMLDFNMQLKDKLQDCTSVGLVSCSALDNDNVLLCCESNVAGSHPVATIIIWNIVTNEVTNIAYPKLHSNNLAISVRADSNPLTDNGNIHMVLTSDKGVDGIIRDDIFYDPIAVYLGINDIVAAPCNILH